MRGAAKTSLLSGVVPIGITPGCFSPLVLEQWPKESMQPACLRL